MIWREPKVELIKEVKTRRVNQPICVWLILGPEEDRRCEDSLESLNNSPIVTAIRSKAEEIEHLKGSGKTDGAAFLLDSQSGDPNRDQSVLAEGQAELGMSDDLEKELSIFSPVG